MKLQKQLSRKVGDKEYAKYVIVIPHKEVKRAGLKWGDKLEVEVKNSGILIKKV